MKNEMKTYLTILAVLGQAIVPPAALAQRGGPGGPGGPPVASLRQAILPPPTGLSTYVRDQKTLVALGKALFWDMQVGSDGRTACASCHFHAGADHRIQNVLAAPATGTTSVQLNKTLSLADFPFRLLSNPADNRSTPIRDTRQVTGSPGVVHRTFFDIDLANAIDAAAEASTGPNIQGVKLRQVTARNSPSVINAVFNFRNFWDGRASNVFSGATPFGDSDRNLNILAVVDGKLVRQAVRMENASLASQAVGPALSEVEMSFAGRSWAKLGKKMLLLRPLAGQQVAADDSVLGPMANSDGDGLSPEYNYVSLIRAAFQPQFWNSEAVLGADGGEVTSAGQLRATEEFSQMELNFPIFWGLAIQAYEATLVSDDTPVDRFLNGDTNALSALERQGLQEFQGGGAACLACHGGPELTTASFTNVLRRGPNINNARDIGFFRTGVSPIPDDPGLNTTDAFGQPLFTLPGAQGAFKSPGLRNVEFTGPYFHDGSQATLDQVMQFYARQGDFPQGGNLGPGIGGIRLNANERAQLVAFMKALSDDRVKFERAPFDHPSICIPIGAAESAPGVLTVDTDQPGVTALEKWSLIEAVGRAGNKVPLQTYEELLQGIGSDGSRAHNLSKSCTQ
jgi:cytochrome c peroxidase